MSAKRPVGRFRKIIPTQKKSRDPRFESFTGRLNQDLFRKSYSFIDDVRQSELKQLREQLANERDEEKREVIRTALQLLVRVVFLLLLLLSGADLFVQQTKATTSVCAKEERPRIKASRRGEARRA